MFSSRRCGEVFPSTLNRRNKRICLWFFWWLRQQEVLLCLSCVLPQHNAVSHTNTNSLTKTEPTKSCWPHLNGPKICDFCCSLWSAAPWLKAASSVWSTPCVSPTSCVLYVSLTHTESQLMSILCCLAMHTERVRLICLVSDVRRGAHGSGGVLDGDL